MSRFQLALFWSTILSFPQGVEGRWDDGGSKKAVSMSTDELLAEALRLTRVDRARVAEELLSSLEESDDEVATAWAAELERRSETSLKVAFRRRAGTPFAPRS